MLRAGDLPHRLTIQRRVEVSDGHDGVTETWLPVRVRLSAQVLALDGRELERARQVDPRTTFEVTLRYWRTHRTDLAGGRVRCLWHDGDLADRTLELVEPPRETEHRERVVVRCREAA